MQEDVSLLPIEIRRYNEGLFVVNESILQVDFLVYLLIFFNSLKLVFIITCRLKLIQTNYLQKGKLSIILWRN